MTGENICLLSIFCLIHQKKTKQQIDREFHREKKLILQTAVSNFKLC